MNGRKITRVVLDAALTVMIIAEMFIQFTGVFLHEVIGFAFFATIVAHLILSAKWIKNTASTAKKGKMTGRRTALAVMGILLAINTVVLGVSSVAISTILAGAGLTWTLGSYALWTAVHSVSSYTLCALVTVHLAMHWAFLASAFRVPYDPSRRQAINTSVRAAAAVGALALGVMAVNQVPPISQALGNGNGEGNGNGATTQARNGNAFSSVSDVPNGKSSSSASPGHHVGGGDKMDENAVDAGETSSSSQGAAPSQDDSSSGGGSSVASGICTLCRKQCPLSDPKCDRPYREGLL